MKLTDYAWEIYDIAKEQDKDVGVARDMFLANIKNAGEDALPYYEGAEEVDYLALKAHLPQQGTEEYAKMCNAFNRDFEGCCADNGD